MKKTILGVSVNYVAYIMLKVKHQRVKVGDARQSAGACVRVYVRTCGRVGGRAGGRVGWRACVLMDTNTNNDVYNDL